MINPNRLRRLRLDRGLSQRKLAAEAGVDPLTIKRLEHGADPGDLPLRALHRLATALGIPAGDLLATPNNDTDRTSDDLVATLGSALAATTGPVTLTALADTARASRDEVVAALHDLAAQLAPTGIALARHGDHAWLAPRHAEPLPLHRDRPLDVNQARLLRRIHRAEDVRRKLTRAERQFTLPSLLRLGLVGDENGHFRVTADVDASVKAHCPRAEGE